MADLLKLHILPPDDLIGKVISCIICICMCSNPIGQFIYGIIFEHIGKIKAKPAEPGVV